MKKIPITLLISVLITLFTLSGCGQTGPLYLPEDTNKTTAS